MMDENRLAEIVASMVGEDRGVLEQYCVELVDEVKRLRVPLKTRLRQAFGRAPTDLEILQNAESAP